MAVTAKRKRATRKATPKSKGLQPSDCVLDATSDEIADVEKRVEQGGGSVIGASRDPLGGSPLLMAVLPIDLVEPTPFQRDLSEAHHRKLAGVIQRIGVFLDPIIAVPAPGGGFWTPNGMHRLAAMRRLGARSITALIVPNRNIAWQILALNTEKAHNLKERALEVIRIYRGLLKEDDSRPESDFDFYLEEAALVTLGICYEQRPAFAGGAYHPILRKVENFSNDPLKKAIRAHDRHASLVQDLDEKVTLVVARLKEKGLTSPYLRNFVVSRINPLRWVKGEPPLVTDVLETMRDRAEKFNVDKVRPQDLAAGFGVPES
jgi:ParB family chromosome partitioning protein